MSNLPPAALLRLRQRLENYKPSPELAARAKAIFEQIAAGASEWNPNDVPLEERCDELAGMTGVDPENLTLRQLVSRRDGRIEMEVRLEQARLEVRAATPGGKPAEQNERGADVFLSAHGLAQKLDPASPPYGAVRKRLARLRDESDRGWKEQPYRGRRQVKYLYHVGTVWPHLADLERPARPSNVH